MIALLSDFKEGFMKKVKILVGSVHGTAEDMGDFLAEQFAAAGLEAEVETEPTLESLTEAWPDLLLVCTSTTGQGDLPDNIAPFFFALRERFPLLTGLPCAVVALGDSAYGETFALGGQQFAELLLELQAQPLLPSLKLDAGAAEDPYDTAALWCHQLVEAFQKVSGSTP